MASEVASLSLRSIFSPKLCSCLGRALQKWPLNVYVGPSWGYVGPSGVYVGAMVAHLGVMVGLCCHILASCWTMLWAMLDRRAPPEVISKHPKCATWPRTTWTRKPENRENQKTEKTRKPRKPENRENQISFPPAQIENNYQQEEQGRQENRENQKTEKTEKTRKPENLFVGRFSRFPVFAVFAFSPFSRFRRFRTFCVFAFFAFRKDKITIQQVSHSNVEVPFKFQRKVH